jgi:4,5-DOPA dioxygenase extradiol
MSAVPSLFIGHGNPMNALQDNVWVRAWKDLGTSLARPRAVLCVSAHWYIAGTAVTAVSQPRTIHDFGGFPNELYQVQYPAPGMPELAARVAQLLSPEPVALDRSWGLDHGAWSILVHLYPQADVPVIQLSINETREASWHFEIARRLAPLRDEGVLILGSGNLVHNLHAYSWGRRVIEPYDWAVRFETRARELLRSTDFAPLVRYEDLGSDAMLAAPTPEHYLPLLYVLAQHRAGESIRFPVKGFDGGSISMLSVQVGYGQCR